LVDEQKQKQQQTQNLYEGKNQNLRTVEVSLDNADTEGAPFKLCLGGDFLPPWTARTTN